MWCSPPLPEACHPHHSCGDLETHLGLALKAEFDFFFFLKDCIYTNFPTGRERQSSASTVDGGCLVLLGEICCKESTAPWLPVVCMEDTS